MNVWLLESCYRVCCDGDEFLPAELRDKGKCINSLWTEYEFPPERLDCVSLSLLGIMGSWEVRLFVLAHWSCHPSILLLGGCEAGVL